MDNFTLFISLAVAVTALAFSVSVMRTNRQRRVAEIKAARDALDSFYDTVSDIIDDPALPSPAVEVLASLTEIISDRDMAIKLVAGIAKPRQASNERSVAIDAISNLHNSRPDLEEKFHRAMASALVALHLRWPENAPRFYAFVAEIASNGRKEAQIASRISEIKRRSMSVSDDSGGPVGGLPVPA